MKLGLILPNDEGAVNGQILRFRELRDMAQLAEQVGFDSLWMPDHLLSRFPGEDEKGFWEVFTFLSGLAAVTSRIQLGPLVACTSFRNPALLARMADSLDEISDGRFILGLGAGGHEPEYRAFGYPFDHRASRFEEALQIIVPLLREGYVDFEGQYYQTREAVLRPRGPSPYGPPIWIDTSRPRMLELIARYADAWNSTAQDCRADRIAVAYPSLLEACQKVGRYPTTVELTASVEVHLLSPGERRTADMPEVTGTAEELAELHHEFAIVGVTHLIVIAPSDIANIERFARVIERLNQKS